MTRWHAGQSGIQIMAQARDFTLLQEDRGQTQPPVKWVQAALSWMVNGRGMKLTTTLPSSVNSNNECSHTSSPPRAFMMYKGSTLLLQLTAMEIQLHCNNQPLHWCATCNVNVYNQCLGIRRQIASLLNLNLFECFQTGSLPFSTYTNNTSHLKIEHAAVFLLLNTTLLCTTNLWHMVWFLLKC